jgi:formamidopyrimidine-DNA glycosylase
MPELPEVETAKNLITPHIIGKTISFVKLSDKKMRLPFGDLAEKSKGKKVLDITRRGKYIVIKLSQGNILLHLGMSGNLRLSPCPALAHDHLEIDFGGNSIILNDPRRFGLAVYFENSHTLLDVLGIEPLLGDFNGRYLYELTRSSIKPIKVFIMDSHKIVGVGNIYASESLFMSRILPTRKTSSLSKKECELLAENIKKVLLAAIESGGSSIRDYVGGYFQHHFSVYGKDGKPCEVCGSLIQKIVQTSRATFYCHLCQL